MSRKILLRMRWYTKFHIYEHELERTWICPGCSMVIQRRPKNDDTPVRSQRLPLDDTNMSIDERLLEDQCILGDIINMKSQSSPAHLSTEINRGEVSLSLELIGNLLDEKLRANAKCLQSKIYSSNRYYNRSK